MLKKNLTIAVAIVMAFGLGAFAQEMAKSRFTDLTEKTEANSWYFDAANWAGEKGLIMGVDGKFMPDAQLTRAQLAVILKRYEDYRTGKLPAPQQPSTPQSTLSNLVKLVVESPLLNTLEEAVINAELVETLSSDQEFTIFAPTDEAFASTTLGETVKKALQSPMDKEKLADLLKFHVIPTKALSKDLKDGQKLVTVQGGTLVVSMKDGKVMVNGATVVKADLEGSNGVIHLIDTVLIPE